MDSDSDNQSDTTEQMDESDDLDDLRVSLHQESADIIIRNYNANPIQEPLPLPNNTITFEPEREFENAGENSEQFDRDLPPEHLINKNIFRLIFCGSLTLVYLKYLGNLERVSASECLKPGKYYHRMPIFAHHSLVFPGEQIPMILLQSVFMTTNFLTDSNGGCLFGLMFLRLKGVPKFRTYGVTCQIYEKGSDTSGNVVFKSKACQRFVINHKLKENENFLIYDMMHRIVSPQSPQRCTATVQILPEVVLGDPLLSHSSNNVKKFFRNSSVIKKIRCFEAGSVAWPLFVYDQYSISDISERAKSFLTKIKVDTMPSDPVALSFWLCKNILPNEDDRLSIFICNSVTDRIQIIGKSMNVIQFFIRKHCRSKLAKFNTLFAMSKQGVQSSYCNPSGFIHETNTVYSTLHNAVYVTGRPTEEFSWFPGYSWQIASCSTCHNHLGLKFLAIKECIVPKSFFGLSGSCVLIEKEEKTEPRFVGFASIVAVLNYGRLRSEGNSTDDGDETN